MERSMIVSRINDQSLLYSGSLYVHTSLVNALRNVFIICIILEGKGSKANRARCRLQEYLFEAIVLVFWLRILKKGQVDWHVRLRFCFDLA